MNANALGFRWKLLYTVESLNTDNWLKVKLGVNAML